jgi:hypothetical protein
MILCLRLILSFLKFRIVEENKYLKIDQKVDKIINLVSKYMTNLNIEYIRIEILKAYEYTKEAHE